MISLKTLDDASAQDVFNCIVNHLMSQKERSISADGSCMYYGQNGLKCAAGILIAYDEYHWKMEGKSWCNLVDAQKIYTEEGKEIVVPSSHNSLICDLQDVHDQYNPDEWGEALRSVGSDHGLKWQYEEKK